ncbi:hypothetical protein TrCOL_g7670 [Triparma columacea]|uniref:Uncharacterized protein n=1 Tax=Triparma columacea TaxID=722753 RepID=A0A9W7GHS7_9STRA|nr:hypothetical protein TrCOL_g7670 [Triparma columacea]
MTMILILNIALLLLCAPTLSAGRLRDVIPQNSQVADDEIEVRNLAASKGEIVDVLSKVSDGQHSVFAAPKFSESADDVEVFIANAKLLGFFDLFNDDVVVPLDGATICDCCGCPCPCSQCTPKKIRICCNSGYVGGDDLEPGNGEGDGMDGMVQN